MTWPALPAFSANNWPVDHFNTGGLDATKWTLLTSGSAAVSITDSFCDINLPAVTDAALVYAKQGIPTNKSQLWVFAFSRQSGGSNDLFYVVQGVPSLGTRPGANAPVRIGGYVQGASPGQMTVYYYDSAHSVHSWDSGSRAWQPNWDYPAGVLAADDDYYLVGLEVDGANARWRMLGWGNHYTTEGVWQANQGLVLAFQTDWVNFSTMETTSSLYLCLGRLYTDIGTAAAEFRYEWARYAEGPRIEAWCDHKAALASTENIGHYWSFDGEFWVPENAANVALDVTAAAWDSDQVMEPFVVYDGVGTDYLFYQGNSDGVTQKIGVAKAPHVAGGPQNGPWTKGASNPILNPSGTAESRLYSPFVVCDLSESDPNRRWKMLYAALSSADNKIRIYGATAPDPPDTSPWTRQGLVLDVGATGAPDEAIAENPFAIRRNGQWEVWYNGRTPTNTCHTLRATGAGLFGQTKDGVSYRSGQSGGATYLTATPGAPDRTLNVNDTTGFVVDGRVSLEVDGTNDKFATSRIRGIPTPGSPGVIELYHGVTGFTTTYPSPIEQADHSITFNHRTIIQVGGTEWWFYYEAWSYWEDHNPSFDSLEQDMHLAKVSDADPTAAPITWQQLPSNVIPLGYNNDQRVARAIGLLLQPFSGDPPVIVPASAPTLILVPATATARGDAVATATAPALSLLPGVATASGDGIVAATAPALSLLPGAATVSGDATAPVVAPTLTLLPASAAVSAGGSVTVPADAPTLTLLPGGATAVVTGGSVDATVTVTAPVLTLLPATAIVPSGNRPGTVASYASLRLASAS